MPLPTCRDYWLSTKDAVTDELLGAYAIADRAGLSRCRVMAGLVWAREHGAVVEHFRRGQSLYSRKPQLPGQRG